MVITKFIRRTAVVPELESKNKPEALDELTQVLFERKEPEQAQQAFDSILARESTESTGIGRGIAVPHARVTGLKSLQCAVGRSTKGIDFMAVDKEKVHLIFLICYPPTEQTRYLNFVATVSKLLSNKERRQGMLEAETADEMYAILEESSATFAETHEEEYAEKLKSDPALDQMKDAHTSVILLARLQLCQEMLDAARSGKGQIRGRIETIRNLIDPRILSHYDRLMKSRPPALVPVEGDTCQGCFMRLSSKFVQQVRQDTSRLHTCQSCKRFIYVV